MLKSILIFLILLNISCGKNSATNTQSKFSPAPSFLIAGQSNGVSPLIDAMGVNSRFLKLTIIAQNQSNQVEPKSQNRDVSWNHFANFVGRTVTITNIAQGNTSTRRWVSNELNTRWLKAKQIKPTYDAIFWIQGESDFGERITQEESYNNLKTIINHAKAQFPNATFYLALNGVQPNSPIRLAQEQIIRERLAAQGPDLDAGIRARGLAEHSLGEFVGQGLKVHAQLWFNVIKSRL